MIVDGSAMLMPAFWMMVGLLAATAAMILALGR